MTAAQADKIYTIEKGNTMDGYGFARASKKMASLAAGAALAIGILTPNHSTAAGVWTNEPAGSNVLVDCPFNSVSSCGILDVYSSGQITSDSSAPVSPSNAVVSKLYAYEPTGGAQLVYTVPNNKPVREMYLGFTWRTNRQFQGRIVLNKIFFIRGPLLGNGYFGMWNPPGSPTMVLSWNHNTSGLDNSHTCQLDSGLHCPPNVGPSLITLGQWAKVEVYQKASTTATSRDGIVRWWVNGIMGGNYTNINYAPSGLNEWQWNHTWDGAQDMGKSNTVDWEHWVDHIHISVPNGGTSTDNPPGPPATPSLRGITVP